MHGDCQSRIVHAGNTTGHAWKTDRGEGMLALGLVDGDQSIAVEDAESIEIEISPEKNAAGLALAWLDHERRAGKAPAMQVHDRIGRREQVERDAGLSGETSKFIAMVLRGMRHQGAGRFNALAPLLAAAAERHQLLRIGAEDLDHGAGQRRFLPPHFLRRALNAEHGQMMDILQFALFEAALLKRDLLGRQSH